MSHKSTTFADDNYTSTLIEVVHPNTMDAIYCRCRSTIYVKIKAADGLERGGIYLNIGDKNITYHGRVYVPGESFVCLRWQAMDKLALYLRVSETIYERAWYAEHHSEWNGADGSIPTRTDVHLLLRWKL